ncbi:ADP,ATP carrier protein 1 [Chlamydiales bacterium SCGC AG-110-P3]|nr:ADP,ATP carrier protein 1 [Chlamydiales bacterium SCGC AG-110-P3]
MSQTDNAFRGWRLVFWPIRRHELPKLLPMFIMLFLICFNYSILRNLKDAVVITARSSGAQVLPFIKVWAMLPGAFLATMFYTRLASRYNLERVFYLIISGFLLYFVLFVFVLFPAQDILHPHYTADLLDDFLPKGFQGAVAMYRNWTFTLFYVICELWGCIVLTVLFWGFANQVTEVAEAKRFFGVFTIGGNLAAVAAGHVGMWACNTKFHPELYGSSSWEQTLVGLISLVVFSSLLTMAIFRWLSVNVLRYDKAYLKHEEDSHEVAGKVRVRKKRSLRESFAYLARSRYLLYIAVIVVAYNLVINLVEVIFKDRLRLLCPDPAEFHGYMNYLTSLQGYISTVMAVMISFTIHRLGWTFTALITPISMVVTSAGFFCFLLLPEHWSIGIAGLFSTTPLAMAAIFGGLQNCLSKAVKYSVFDATKEMAFIPLPKESKLKGKAAIDGVGSRLGKSGGSLIHQGLLMVFGTLIASAPYVGALLLVMSGAWIVAVRRLGREFDSFAEAEIQDRADDSSSTEEEVLVQPMTTDKPLSQSI